MTEQKASRLQEEIQQTVPFRSRSQEAAIAIQRTADVLRRRYDQALAPYGVTEAQYNVLRILRGARGKPLPTLEVGARMIQQTPGITRMIDRLESKGLVRREPCAHDRRVVYCVITEAGLALLARTDALVNELDDELGRVLSANQLAAVVEGLERIRRLAG
jgi:DNA-binding MarR family transcriptional regulator